MPTYRYRCEGCGEDFEVWQSIKDDALTTHEACGGAVKKVLSPAGIVLKGSGFYKTDSRSGSNGKTATKEPAASEKSESSSKSEGSGSSGSGGSGSGGSEKKSSETKSDSGSSSSSGAGSSSTTTSTS